MLIKLIIYALFSQFFHRRFTPIDSTGGLSSPDP